MDQLKRYPAGRDDRRASNSMYHWLPDAKPFHVIPGDTAEPSRRRKKRKAINPHMQARADAWKAGLSKLTFQGLVAEKTRICETLDVVAEHFVDEKNNYFFFSFNDDVLTVDEIDERMRENFAINDERGHSREDLLLAVCGSECFVYFASKLWHLWLTAESTVFKLLEIFVAVMSFVNLGDFLSDPVFRASAGLPNPNVAAELDGVPEGALRYTAENREVYAALYRRRRDIESNFAPLDYSDAMLEYLYVYHNDNCVYGADASREYLMSLQENKLVHPGELDGLSCVNKISTAEFKCLTVKMTPEQKAAHDIVGNEHGRAYVVYGDRTPAVRTTEILGEAAAMLEEYLAADGTEARTARLFSEIMNFKIPGYCDDE